MHSDLRQYLLTRLLRLFPFDLRGDGRLGPASDRIKVSCVINFYGRPDLLSVILHCLSEQSLPRDCFEVVLVEDRGGTEAGRGLAQAFSDDLAIVYAPLDRNFGLMGYSRNFALSHCSGEFLLFLDDDTVILQQDFLETLVATFDQHGEIDAVVPHGSANFQLRTDRYGYHDPFFPSNRCTAYRRAALEELGCFMERFVGQEDVEFVTRFVMSGRKSLDVKELNFFHPPLLVPNLRKPMAVGHSFFGLKNRYPRLLWLLLLLNCSRHAPLYLLPGRRYREMGRFGIGFLAGVIASFFRKRGFRYG